MSCNTHLNLYTVLATIATFTPYYTIPMQLNTKMKKLRKSKPKLMSTFMSQIVWDLLWLNPRTVISYERNRRAAWDERFLKHKSDTKLTFYSYEHGIEMLKYLILEKGKSVKLNSLLKVLWEKTK